MQTEFFIKTGLVSLGESLIFSEVLQDRRSRHRTGGARGVRGRVSCLWIARKLRVDDEFAAVLSTAVSICGVSAAIATCGAIKGDKKKLSYVTSLVLIIAVPMMIVMPWIAKSVGDAEFRKAMHEKAGKGKENDPADGSRSERSLPAIDSAESSGDAEIREFRKPPRMLAGRTGYLSEPHPCDGRRGRPLNVMK